MKKLLIIFPILLAFIFLNSCSEYACTSGELRIGLKGFSDTEADTIIVRRFFRNTPQLKDTFLVDHIWFERNLDTLELVGTLGVVFPTIEFDYEFYFPEAGRLFKLTNITEEQRFIKKKIGSKVGCVNSIKSYMLDGLQVNTTGFSRTYLNK